MTLLGWMIYALLVGLLVTGAAWCLDRGLSRVGIPTRWVWGAALLVSVSLPAVAPTLASSPAAPPEALAPPAPVVSVRNAGGSETPPASSEPRGVARVVSASFDRAGQELSALLTLGAARLPSGPAADRGALLLWVLLGATLAATLAVSGARMARRRGGWTRSRLRGRPVWLAPDLGPAVVGCTRPEIVLPPWAVRLEPEALEMVLAHEEEHVRARDPLLLTAGLLPGLLLPWNLALWIQLRGLRGAVEVDCDRRVLRRGLAPRRYGALLVRLGSRRGAELLPAPALSGTCSHLTRRLNAMKKRSVRTTVPFALAASVVALGLLLLACEAETPTTQTDEGPEEAVVVSTPPTEAEAGAADAVADAPAPPSGAEVILRREVRVEMEDAPTGSSEAGVGQELIQGDVVIQRRDGESPVVTVRPSERPAPDGSPRPLIVVDGVIVSGDTDLESMEIESIEVIRGAAAAGLYGSRAAAGVINITTTRGATREQSAVEAPSGSDEVFTEIAAAAAGAGELSGPDRDLPEARTVPGTISVARIAGGVGMVRVVAVESPDRGRDRPEVLSIQGPISVGRVQAESRPTSNQEEPGR